MLEDWRTYLRRKFPGLSQRAKTSRPAAIRMFCFECVGGERKDAYDCTMSECFLWPFRPQRISKKAILEATDAPEAEKVS